MPEKTFDSRRDETYPNRKPSPEKNPLDAYVVDSSFDTQTLRVPDDLLPVPEPVPAELYERPPGTPIPPGYVRVGEVPKGMTPEEFKRAYTMPVGTVSREPNDPQRPKPQYITPPTPTPPYPDPPYKAGHVRVENLRPIAEESDRPQVLPKRIERTVTVAKDDTTLRTMLEEKCRDTIQTLDAPIAGTQQKIASTGLHIISTLLKKNQDYGDTGTRSPILVPSLSPVQALKVRLSDKIARLSTLQSQPAAVVQETERDTYMDLAGYAILILVAMQEGEENNG